MKNGIGAAVKIQFFIYNAGLGGWEVGDESEADGVFVLLSFSSVILLESGVSFVH